MKLDMKITLRKIRKWWNFLDFENIKSNTINYDSRNIIKPKWERKNDKNENRLTFLQQTYDFRIFLLESFWIDSKSECLDELELLRKEFEKSSTIRFCWYSFVWKVWQKHQMLFSFSLIVFTKNNFLVRKVIIIFKGFHACKIILP